MSGDGRDDRTGRGPGPGRRATRKRDGTGPPRPTEPRSPHPGDRWYARTLWALALAWLLYMAWLIPYEAGWLGG